jgi:hypothetical protein
VSNLRIRSGELPPVPDVARDPELGKAIKDAQAEMERLIRLGELQNDPIRHPIQALSVHLDALLKLSTAHSQALTRQSGGAAFTDEQVNDIGRRLLGSCQTWSRSLLRGALWKSWSAIAATVLIATILGFGAGWSYRGDLLGPVSKVIAEIAPNSRQIFAADNDWHLPTKDNPQPNVGKEKAEAASKEVGGIVLLPGFGDIEMKGTPTDWNDFAALYGKARLVAAIRQALMEQGIDMEEIKKPKVTQEMRDLARQTTVIQQNDAQINQAREAHRQAEEHSHDNSRGIER